MTMKTQSRFGGLAALCCATALIGAPAFAQMSGDVIRIGVMNDQSGVYADNCGPGSTAAVRLAIEDFNNEINGTKIEVVVADDQNKPDIGVAAARKWVEQDGVDTIVGCSASSIALAVTEIMKANEKPYLLGGTASPDLTGKACSPYTFQWVHDTYALPKGTVLPLLADGQDSWYFITVDYTFGKQYQADATRFIEAAGGKVLGSVLHPLNTTDFSAQLLQAQASGAKVIGIANSGSDFANLVKQAKEFGIAEAGQILAPLGLQINMIHSIGLQTAQGLRFGSAMYWDANDETRAFTERFRKAFNDRYPNEAQLATYTAVKHYLKAVTLAGTDDGKAVAAKMHETPVEDFIHKDIPIRADGQVMRPMLSAMIKAPSDSKYPWDYYSITGEISGADAWTPASESACPALKG
ncbi:ABC transporter substrate-binding protein [Falsigemmobacter intermedius]|nr:ABC transporter substrate-binding protein [Falsigemmobacter intermedius]